MNSRERFLAAIAGEKPDRTPVAHVSAMTTVELQEQTGCRMPEVHHDPAALARLCAANHELLGFDAVTFNINFFGEPAALGCRMNWGAPDELPMYASHPWRRVEDAVVPGDLLDRSPVAEYLETIRIAKRDLGDRVAVLGKVMGPLSMTQVMHGVQETMLALMDAPETIGRFMDVAIEVLTTCANAQFEAGIDALAIGEGGAGANMMSPTMYGRLLQDRHRRMLERIDGPTIMHVCGDITARLEAMGSVGMTCFNFDWDIDPRAMAAATAGRFRLMGNVNTTDLLMSDPDEIEKQVFACLDAGVDIISPGCAVSPRCPNANLRAMSEATAKWHTRPA